MTDWTRKTAAEMAAALKAGEVTSVELTQAHLDRIAAVDGPVHAFLHLDPEGALETARKVDEDRSAGVDLPALAGVPVAVKDVLVTEGLPTTAGSRILEGWIPPYDSTVSANLKAARMPILGTVGVQRVINGPIPYAPDGLPYVGPAFGMPNVFHCCGFSFGICQGGGAGKSVAEWIVDGKPEWDLWSLDPRRYGDYADQRYVVDRATEVYRHEYAIHFPVQE